MSAETPGSGGRPLTTAAPRLGFPAEYGLSWLLPRLVGAGRAADWLLSGRVFPTDEAGDVGLFSAVLPAGEVVNHARRMAERFNALPPSAVRQSKQLMRRADPDALWEAIAAENEVFASRLSSPEAREAFSAFFQKRKPDFGKFPRRP